MNWSSTDCGYHQEYQKSSHCSNTGIELTLHCNTPPTGLDDEKENDLRDKSDKERMQAFANTVSNLYGECREEEQIIILRVITSSNLFFHLKISPSYNFVTSLSFQVHVKVFYSCLSTWLCLTRSRTFANWTVDNN